jgi:hypothetical protein
VVFFIDYFDNTLDEEAIQLLFDFLEVHPDLKEEFDAFENFSLAEPSITLPNKSSLKKHIDESNIEHYIIANLENELSHDDHKEYTDFIAENALYTPTVERYKRTILPLETFIYPNKKNLKQKGRLIILWPAITAIAATIAIFISISTDEQQYQFQALDHLKVLQNEFETPILSITKTAQKQPATSTKEIAKTNIQSLPKKSTKKIKEPLVKKNNPTVAHQQNNIQTNLQQPTIKTNSSIAVVENSATERLNIESSETNIPTLKQTLHNSIKTKVFKDESKNNQLINKDYLLAATKDKLNNAKNITFEQSQLNARKKTRLKIGKFEFYRNKKA